MSLISVRDLVCSYNLNPEDKVLYIRNLDIERGKIVFLLGASGSGKSTLLETLGLMNNTLSGGDIVLDRGDLKFSFAELWKEPGRTTLTAVRRKNLSFIFQNTNLMENFTAYENICLSRMIKEGSDQQTAMAGAELLMTQVGLPPGEVSTSALSVNLSGGQRQRVSFARALNNDFSLLLCDEPTGNLDETNARELLRIIRENIRGDKTAIVVSHDVNLALQFADQIVVINKDPSKGYGEVLPENIFSRDYWTSLPSQGLQEFRSRIVTYFANTREKNVAHKNDRQFKWHKTYKTLFLRKESRILFGKNNMNLLLVMAITMLTLLASGFANGSLEYIRKKYNDPFINWLTIRLPDFKNSGKDIQYYKGKLNEQVKAGRFSILQITSYKDFWLPFFDKEGRNFYNKGRTIAWDDPLLGDLCGEGNLINGQPFVKLNDIALIITDKMLNRVETWGENEYIFMNYHEVNPLSPNKETFRVPIPVRAVVKSIPGKLDFLVTEDFFRAYKNFDQSVFSFDGQQRWQITLFTGSDKALAGKLQQEVEQFVQKGPGWDTLMIDCRVDTCEQVNFPGQYKLIVQFDPMPEDYLVTEHLYHAIRKLPSYNADKVLRIFYYGVPELSTVSTLDNYLSINLAEGGLDQVDSIARFILDEFNVGKESEDQTGLIQIDSGMIKEKKNFNYLGKITFFMAAMLIIFAVMAISLFVSNLLKSHLNRVKMNIGTYKAFGLSDQESTRIYLQIMMRFILLSILGAFLLACGIGYISEYYISHQLKMEENIEYFRIFDWNTLALISLIIGISLAVSYYNIHKILSKTPGDLIYNR